MTNDRDRENVALAISIPWAEKIKLSANVTDGNEHIESRENITPLFLVMWSEAFESIIQVGELNEEKQWGYLFGPKWLWKKMKWVMSEIAGTSDTIAPSSWWESV